MNSNELTTFLLVAEVHSFNKASQQTFVTPAAVMKQIKSLEEEVGTPLFNRHHTGVTLTEAGQLFLPEAQKIVADIDHAKGIMSQFKKPVQTIRIGSSLINPASRFATVWATVEHEIPGIQFIYVPIDEANYHHALAAVGTDVDIVVSPFDLADQSRFLLQEVGDVPFTVMMLANNPLASRTVVNINDLKPMQVYSVPQHRSKIIDQLRQEMAAAGIKLHDTDVEYSVNTFNRLQSDQDAILSLGLWEQVRPNLVSVPLDTKLKMKVAVMISKNSSSLVKKVYRHVVRQFQQSQWFNDEP